MEIRFFVAGKPATSGSKRAMIHPKTGDIIVIPANKRQKSWQRMVAEAATDEYSGKLLAGPVRLEVVLRFMRPKNHFRTGKHFEELRESAPKFPVTRPDALKCVRAIEDALSGVIWRDDSQVVEHLIWKKYGEPEGALIRIDSKEDGDGVSYV